MSAGDMAAIWQRLAPLPIARPLLQPCPELARPRHPVVSDGLDKAGEAELPSGRTGTKPHMSALSSNHNAETQTPRLTAPVEARLSNSLCDSLGFAVEGTLSFFFSVAFAVSVGLLSFPLLDDWIP